MRLQVEPLRPCGELLAAGAAAEDLALDKLCVGAAGRELLERFTHAGAAGGRKEDDGLAGEIVALEEGVDDGRRNVPPALYVKSDNSRDFNVSHCYVLFEAPPVEKV